MRRRAHPAAGRYARIDPQAPQLFNDLTKPLLDFYGSRKLVTTVDGNQHVESVQQAIVDAIAAAAVDQRPDPSMAITIKNEREIELMRQAGHIVALAHARLQPAICSRRRRRRIWTTSCAKSIEENGATPTFFGHLGFTGRICASINEEIVHGIPGKRTLSDGDIISVDIGATFGGFIGDSAWTYPVGSIDDESKKLLEVTEESLYSASSRRLPATGLAILATQSNSSSPAVVTAWSANTAVMVSAGRCGKNPMCRTGQKEPASCCAKA